MAGPVKPLPLSIAVPDGHRSVTAPPDDGFVAPSPRVPKARATQSTVVSPSDLMSMPRVDAVPRGHVLARPPAAPDHEVVTAPFPDGFEERTFGRKSAQDTDEEEVTDPLVGASATTRFRQIVACIHNGTGTPNEVQQRLFEHLLNDLEAIKIMPQARAEERHTRVNDLFDKIMFAVDHIYQKLQTQPHYTILSLLDWIVRLRSRLNETPQAEISPFPPFNNKLDF